MRLAPRAPSSPTATLPLRAQALVPFALALALVVAFAAAGAALVARSAVDRELAAQAETARHLVAGEIGTIQERLTAEVTELGDDAESRASGHGRALEERLMAFSRRERLTLAAALDEGGPAAGGWRGRGSRSPARCSSRPGAPGGRPPGPGAPRRASRSWSPPRGPTAAARCSSGARSTGGCSRRSRAPPACSCAWRRSTGRTSPRRAARSGSSGH